MIKHVIEAIRTDMKSFETTAGDIKINVKFSTQHNVRKQPSTSFKKIFIALVIQIHRKSLAKDLQNT